MVYGKLYLEILYEYFSFPKYGKCWTVSQGVDKYSKCHGSRFSVSTILVPLKLIIHIENHVLY